MTTRVLFLAGVMGLALAQGAQAADHSVQASPFFLPPVNATPDWSGPYIGFNGGYGFGSGSVTGSFFGPIVAAGEPLGFSTAGNPVGAVFGGQVGYNWQYGHFVVGGETDLNWVGAKSTFTPTSNLFGCGPCAVSATNELNWMATFRARGGYAFDNLFLFGTAGLALGGIDDHWGLGFVGGGTPAFSDTQFRFQGVRSGFIYGGGAEYALNGSWRVRFDVMHVDFGTVSATYIGPTTFVLPGTFTTNFHNSATLGHLALSYRW
jgi:outer membrane immunogenic protein